MDPILDKCDVCNSETKFRSAGVMMAGRSLDVRLENWLCSTCEKFYLLYALSSQKTFLISKTYEHKYITISLVYDPFTKEVFEIKIAKLYNSDSNLVIDPKKMYIDPLHPDEISLLSKLEVYETFS